MNWQKTKTLIFVFILIVMLILVRFFEHWFYDPFLTFFKSDYHHKTLPQFEGLKLFLSLTLRYSINTLLSLCVIWLLFKQKEYIRFALIFYSIAFAVLMVLFQYFIHNHQNFNYLPIFYSRRFLIQPLFLLLLLPAFHYINTTEK